MPSSDTSADAPARALPLRRNWDVDFAGRLAVTDAGVVTWAVLGAQFARFGLDESTPVARLASTYDPTLNYTIISALVIAGWLIALAAYRTRDGRIVGSGSDEYKRVATASLMTFGLMAIVAFIGKVELARGYVLLAFPIGLLALLVSRWMWRSWLVSKRRRGQMCDRVILLGSLDSVAAVARDLIRMPSAGYWIVGAIIPGERVSKHLPGTTVPILHVTEGLTRHMDAHGANTIIVTSSDDLPPERIRQISWALEPGRHHLVMAPTLTDIGGPRIHTRPVAGLPLVHVETPRYEGAAAFTKRLLDIVGSTLLLVVSSPVLLVIALLVKLTSPGGPVLFIQQRVGRAGDLFPMFKFRTMVPDAEERLKTLLEQREELGQDAGNTVLFKMKDDPRITPIGRFLRRYSLDELPQLLNVLIGQMSLVGPRPPLPREVEHYEDHVHRKFLVKPGLTGLWQVSGRSKLSWEDSVRLDLYYVDNWSVMGDLVLLWRTFKAVVGRDGAY